MIRNKYASRYSTLLRENDVFRRISSYIKCGSQTIRQYDVLHRTSLSISLSPIQASAPSNSPRIYNNSKFSCLTRMITKTFTYDSSYSKCEFFSSDQEERKHIKRPAVACSLQQRSPNVPSVFTGIICIAHFEFFAILFVRRSCG